MEMQSECAVGLGGLIELRGSFLFTKLRALLTKNRKLK